ncbi:MOXD1 homolog 1 [Neodiprion fabricii]|uniref:MOXD1 homolog 1 n=1 Tax=Neodiprion fabricii TaxID=2872261 RepID=UPI001ED95F91|nr:MOXD1 homolog 1 [Neodiprion fabricii]XP_046409389.1 MOXD1 homolog 1 [Neodiprion fabricii]
MPLSRVILFLGLCWVVQCDLLDLYVQHMDETMKTIVYEKTHVKNLARIRNKRSALVSGHVADEEAFYKFGNFKKQRLEVDEGWEQPGPDDKSGKKVGGNVFIEKDDGLNFQNDREENMDPKHYEILERETTERLEALMDQDWDAKYKAKNKKVLLKEDDGLAAENAAEESTGANEDFELIKATKKQEQLEAWESSQEFLPEFQFGPVSTLDVLPSAYDETVDMDLEEESELKAFQGASTSNEEANKVVLEDEEDVNLEIEVLGEPDDRSGFEAPGNPSLKRKPKALGERVPKKYNAPAGKDTKLRKTINDKESTTSGFAQTVNATRSKRSAKKPRFSRREKLDDDGLVLLEWDPSDEDVVTFRVTARTLGYVGIGFNEKSHMKGADILLAWIDDDSQRINLLDSHGIEERNAAPVTDLSQDVEILEGSQNDTHTTVTFSRRWHTCDPHDHRLTGDTIHVLWALHETDPELNIPAGHGEMRGGRALRLKAPAPHPPPNISTPGIRQWDIKLNQFTVSSNLDTVYWCKIFKAPPLGGKHHMIGYTPLVEKANEALVHHIILYECASVAPILGEHARIAGAACYSPTMPREWDSCLQPVVAWARGSKGEWFPEHVGIPVAEHNDRSYYMLEVHYNNPGLKEVVDSSGITLHLTPNLRPQEAGILVTGVAISPLHMVPPRQKEYATAGYCTPHCTKKMFPEDGINIISVVLHSHLAGRRLGLKHIRQGKELPRIVQDNHFDFNYQQSHTLENEVKVLPGDELVAECVYGTLDRARPTMGGYAATQEMCLAFVVHYPRTPLAACYSMTPVKDLFKTLGVHSFRGITFDHLEKLVLTIGTDSVTLPTITQQQPIYPLARPSGEINMEMMKEAEMVLRDMAGYTEEQDEDSIFARLVIENPEEFRGRTLAEHMLALPWTEELLARSIEQSLYHGRHMTFCRKRDDKLAVPADIQMFPNFTALPEANETNCDPLRDDSGCSALNAPAVLVALVISISNWRLLLRM